MPGDSSGRMVSAGVSWGFSLRSGRRGCRVCRQRNQRAERTTLCDRPLLWCGLDGFMRHGLWPEQRRDYQDAPECLPVGMWRIGNRSVPSDSTLREFVKTESTRLMEPWIRKTAGLRVEARRESGEVDVLTKNSVAGATIKQIILMLGRDLRLKLPIVT